MGSPASSIWQQTVQQQLKGVAYDMGLAMIWVRLYCGVSCIGVWSFCGFGHYCCSWYFVN